METLREKVVDALISYAVQLGFWLPAWLWPMIRRHVLFLNGIHSQIGFWAVGTGWILLSVLLHAWQTDIFLIVFIPGAAILILYFRYIIGQFWFIGVVRVDRSTRTGLDYKRSLDLCKDSIKFLGIGASKLTDERASFSAAIQRCNRDDRAIRFLLCRPEHDKLQTMALQATQDRDAYRTKVRNSLRVLAEEHLQKKRNIEVRFYDELPLFRLMFINMELCLASHYVFGEGDGSDLPQAHLRRGRAGRGRDVEGWYYTFDMYFEDLWNKSEAWDPTEYLT